MSTDNHNQELLDGYEQEIDNFLHAEGHAVYPDEPARYIRAGIRIALSAKPEVDGDLVERVLDVIMSFYDKTTSLIDTPRALAEAVAALCTPQQGVSEEEADRVFYLYSDHEDDGGADSSAYLSCNYSSTPMLTREAFGEAIKALRPASHAVPDSGERALRETVAVIFDLVLDFGRTYRDQPSMVKAKELLSRYESLLPCECCNKHPRTEGRLCVGCAADEAYAKDTPDVE